MGKEAAGATAKVAPTLPFLHDFNCIIAEARSARHDAWTAPAPGSRHERPARIAARSCLAAIHVNAVFAVIWRGEEWEVLGDAVRRNVHTDCSRRAGEEVNAIAD